MGFWNALSVLGPIAPAQAEAQDIRADRDRTNREDAQQYALKQEQVKQARQKTQEGSNPVIFGQPEWDPTTNQRVALALTPDGKITRVPVPGGESPEATKQREFKNAIESYKQVTGQDATPEMQQALWASTFGGIKSGFASAAAQDRLDYAAYLREHPDYTGSFDQWKAAQTATGRASVPKPQSKDDRYIALIQKKQMGQPLSPDEQAYHGAYDFWTQKTKVDPGIARAVAFGANRYLPVVDPNEPENVVIMRAGDAARAGVGTPASIAFQTDKALTRAFTSGAPAQTINYFNTATEHLKQLQEAADALQNGDVQLFNKAANAWSTATGLPAPTNFQTIRNAVAGELSKTFKGAAATDAEIDAINTSINSSQSPAQLSGAIQNNIRLMGSKMDALRGQYQAGKRGQPNFPGTAPAQQYKKGDPIRLKDGTTATFIGYTADGKLQVQ